MSNKRLAAAAVRVAVLATIFLVASSCSARGGRYALRAEPSLLLRLEKIVAASQLPASWVRARTEARGRDHRACDTRGFPTAYAAGRGLPAPVALNDLRYSVSADEAAKIGLTTRDDRGRAAHCRCTVYGGEPGYPFADGLWLSLIGRRGLPGFSRRSDVGDGSGSRSLGELSSRNPAFPTAAEIFRSRPAAPLPAGSRTAPRAYSTVSRGRYSCSKPQGARRPGRHLAQRHCMPSGTGAARCGRLRCRAIGQNHAFDYGQTPS